MPDQHLIALFFFGSAIVLGSVLTVVVFVLLYKQREARNRLESQRQEYEYSQSLLSTKLEVRENTLNMIAQELHDNVVHALTGCSMQMDMLRTDIASLDGDRRLASTKSDLEASIKNVRLLSHSLATGLVEHRELQEAIHVELERIENSNNIECSLRSHTLHEPDPVQRLFLFRIVQEAVQNCLKHAQASQLIITLDSTDDYYEVAIKDDGLGFDQTIVTSSLGLMNMKERAKWLNGELIISSSVGKGTTIMVRMPINTTDGEDKNSLS